ncbi:MAG: hypothetical protein JXR58_03745, partial [Bacteroidales bacterium]|nr:hypothetical protein [Bacteroidales bacterium]
IVGLKIMSKKTKQQQQVTKPVKIKEPEYKFSKQAKYSVFGIIIILSFILYGNTLNHKYALDDKMAVYQNRFVLKGSEGIGDLLRTDFFHGFFGKNTNNVEGGRYRPLSLVSYAIEYEIFMTSPFKDLEYKQLKLKIDGPAQVSGKDNSNSNLEELHKQLNKSLLLDIEKDRIHRQQALLNLYPVITEKEKQTILNNLKVSYGDIQNVMFFSHFMNILLYAIAGILLFIFLARLCIKIPYKKWYLSVPFLTAILFIVHPLHTEVVANIKGRDEIMSLLFSLLAGISIFKYIESKKPIWLAAIFVSFMAAMFSKENAVLFLALFPVAIYLFSKHNLPKVIIALIPMIIVFGIYMLVRESVISAGDLAETKKDLMNYSFVEMTIIQKAATIFFTLILYLKLLVVPHPLTWDYYPYHIEIMDFSNPWVLLSVIINIAIFGLAAFFLAKIFFRYLLEIPNALKFNASNIPDNRLIGSFKAVLVFSLLVYVLNLLPVSNIFLPVGAFMNERFVFVGLLGFCFILTYLVLIVLPKKIKNTKTYYPGVMAFLLIIIALYSIKTINRNNAWKDSFTLFTTDIHTSPNSAKGNSSVGGEYLEKAEFTTDSLKKAEYIKLSLPYFYKAIEIHEEFTEPLIRLGKAYYDLELNYDSLFHYFGEVLRYDPANKDVHGNMLGMFANFTDEDFKKIVFDKVTLAKLGHEKNAILQKHRMFYNQGIIFGKFRNDSKMALQFFEKALKFIPNDFMTLRAIGLTHGISGNFAESVKAFEEALKQKEDATVYINLSVSYYNLGNTERADFCRQKAIQLNPALQPKQ